MAFEAIRRNIVGILCILLLVVSGIAYYFYRASYSGEAGTQANQEAEIQAIVDKVGRLVVLPNNEKPTLATVVDLEKLKDQPFFANASKGDKVLIYTTARKAILYSPVLDKIVEVAPINIGGASMEKPVPAAQGR